MQLPVTFYTFDRRTNEYTLTGCLLCEVPCTPPPHVLNCSSGLGILGDGLELLKASMRTPAIVLRHGTRCKTLDASGDEVHVLPPTRTANLIRAYEMTCINLSTSITHYRLRADGTLVLSCVGKLNCATCFVPDSLRGRSSITKHLQARAGHIRKMLRDRRIVVNMGSYACVYAVNTLRLRSRMGGEEEDKFDMSETDSSI